MEYKILGRTGLEVSVVGLGCGGPSRIGQKQNKSEAESIRVVREALDAGINIVDTAESYGTEALVGKALSEVRRGDVIISTKKSTWGDATLTEAAINQCVDASLERLRTDYIDIYHLHAVLPDVYSSVRDEVVPILLDLKEKGKIRFLGITEMFHRDSGHAMLQQALLDDCWDVMMVGFNLLNQSARDRVFAGTLEKNIGTLIMFAVRRALSRKERLLEALKSLLDRGLLSAGSVDLDEPLEFLVHEEGASDVTEAAYRYCRHEPGVDVVLSGTGNVEHLRTNIRSMLREDLPKADREKLDALFARVDDISAD